MDANAAAQVLAKVSTVLYKQQELMEKIENKPPAQRRVEGITAAWYITQQHAITGITALAAALRSEFIPPDPQERLRDSLYQLKQRECRDLAEYVTKYR
ncbi:hypothetical protein PC115_g21474 [Phytophthora cactorum]|uniref:Retrotransposon gag domain-containing protein n=1 Tax=Phytophthora cactorum TaxID=29920 RepID=A0A8T1B3X1_9STRA|nr:hypothetical protein PC115_g21474 [Phytophthora cactorum]KAG2892653.1 hypothetical protein PC117_g23963 [Phytophthora cactorum]